MIEQAVHVAPMLGDTLRSLGDMMPMAVPDPGAGAPPPGSDKFLTIMGWIKWGALGVCVLSLIIAGAALGFGGHRGEGGEHAKRIGYILVGVAIISGAVSLVSMLA